VNVDDVSLGIVRVNKMPAGQAWMLFESFAVGAHGLHYDNAMSHEPTQADAANADLYENRVASDWLFSKLRDAVGIVAVLVYETG